MLVRDKRCQMAFLEVARGGILRRGLPVKKVNAVLITNIASDHLGQYGINTVAELAQTKFVVVKALQRDGVLVLNANDPLIVECASSIMLPICWFSRDEFHPLIQAQIQHAQRAVFVRNNHIIYHYKGQFEDLGDISAMPMTFGGAALHNVQNALGVVGLSKALNLANRAIIQGLSEFGRDSQDNPGRGNIYHVKGCQVIVDFAHNEHGMQAMINLAMQLNGKDYIAMFSHAGDRSDEDIAKLTQAVSQLNAKLYIAAETQKYLRGRLPHEVTSLSKKYLVDCGVEPSLIEVSDSPLQGAKLALQMASPGDVILLFVHDQREQVHQFLMHESE
jgi:cyanophycin synthetase